MEHIQNRDYVEQFQQNEIPARGRQDGTHLHLGCAKLVIPGYHNVDKYVEYPGVINSGMLEYCQEMPNSSVDTIFSSHAIEHLPYRHATALIKEWGRITAKGGQIFLAIPDLELIMRFILEGTVSEERKWEWYIYCLFGYQSSPLIPARSDNAEATIDHGQFHTCGFTAKRIRSLLEGSGFIIQKLLHYDGWQTPSIWVEAKKI